MKATYVEVNGEARNIMKQPVTDDGTKVSASGLLAVHKKTGAHGYSLELKEKVSWSEVEDSDNQLKLRYYDGRFYNKVDFNTIRRRVKEIQTL